MKQHAPNPVIRKHFQVILTFHVDITPPEASDDPHDSMQHRFITTLLQDPDLTEKTIEYKVAGELVDFGETEWYSLIPDEGEETIDHVIAEVMKRMSAEEQRIYHAWRDDPETSAWEQLGPALDSFSVNLAHTEIAYQK